MASLLELGVSTGKWDSGLKKAQQSLNNFVSSQGGFTQALEKNSESMTKFVSMMGNMESKAKTMRGQLSEYRNSFEQLTLAYQKLTDEEKKGEFGQALSQTLDQLKTKIADSKQSLDSMNAELGNTSKQSDETGGVLDALAGKFGLNVTQAGALGAALGVATVATKVAKDAFFSNEEQLDEWGRVVASSESLYRGFLDALNTGDISGFLSRMDSIVAAARQAYNALDELATFNAFNQINVARTRQQLMDAQNDYREGTGSKERVRSAAGAYKGELGQRQQLEKKAYAAAIVEYANNRGVNPVDLARVMLGSYGDYSKIKSMPLTGTKTEIKTNMYGMQWAQTTKVAANEMERMGAMLRRFNDTELKELQGLGARFYQTGFEKGQIDRQVNRILNGRQGGAAGGGGGSRSDGSGGGKSGGGGGGRTGGGTPTYVPAEGSIDKQAALVASLQKQWKAAADDESRAKIKEQIEAANKELDRMQGKIEAPVGSLKYYNAELQKLQDEQQLVTSNNDWKYYAGQIDVVTRKIKELKGEVEKVEMVTGQAGATGNSISGWISAQQKALGDMEIGSAASRETYANIIDAQTLQNVLNYTLANDITISPDTIEELWEKIIGGENVPDSIWENLAQTINDAIAETEIDPIKINVETGEIVKTAKATKEGWQDAAKAVQSVGGALQQIENPSAKIAGLIGEAIANIALGFAQATASDSKLGVFGWIAAIAGGMATMLTTISAIHSAAGYAEGGIVGGHSFSNDHVPIMANSGELILNRAQQGNIASQLSGGINNLNLSAVISGEDIRLVLNNNGRRTGRGEYVTTKRG